MVVVLEEGVGVGGALRDIKRQTVPVATSPMPLYKEVSFYLSLSLLCAVELVTNRSSYSMCYLGLHSPPQ